MNARMNGWVHKYPGRLTDALEKLYVLVAHMVLFVRQVQMLKTLSSHKCVLTTQDPMFEW